jgi:FAD/FMN-containing dehydrogenase
MSVKEDLMKIVGKGNVSDAPEDLEKYAKDESPVHPVRPQCIVRPGSGDDVQKLVTWANETITPLVPVSSGPPHFRGDTIPGTGGAVIVDLTRMKKIIRVDAEHRIAMVEPGVTFSELIPELAKKGLRLNMPLLPRATKSVMGSLLEREPVIMPQFHWDIADPLACTEVIYGTGDMFRTGSAAGPGDLQQQWEIGAAQNEAAGPVQADFYRLIQGAQGTMGIVTWATVRCERMPSIEEPFLVGSSNLEHLLEFTRWILRRRLVDDCLLLNNTDLAHMLARDWPQEYESLKNSLPPWILFFSISGVKYFPEEELNYQKEAVANIAKSLKIELLKAIGRVSAYELIKVLHRPSEEPYWKLRDRGSCYDVFFLTTHDKLPELVSVMNGIAEKCDYPTSNMGIYIQPIVQGVSCHCEFNLFFEPGNSIEENRIRTLSEAAFEALANRGAFFSRPYGPWADLAYRRDAVTTISLRKIKDIYDPNKIMNPGKLCF